mgnify:CR=1 FL=1
MNLFSVQKLQGNSIAYQTHQTRPTSSHSIGGKSVEMGMARAMNNSVNMSVGQSEFIHVLRGMRAGQPDNAFSKAWINDNVHNSLNAKIRPQTAIHQRN